MLKKILMIAAALFLIGAIVFFIAFAASGFSFNGLSSLTTEDRLYTESQDNKINAISLKYSNADISISLGDTFSVSYPVITSKGGSPVSEVRVSDTNGRLVISERIDPIKAIGFGRLEPKIVITLPADRVTDLAIETDNGSISVEGTGIPVGIFTADTDNGDIDIDRLSAKKIGASTDNGSVTVKDVTATDGISLETDNGEIEMHGNVTAASLEAEASNGDISHEGGAIFASRISISTEIGDIEATFAGSEADYTVLVEKSIGNSNISNSTGGEKRAELETDVGDIEIHFLG